MLQRAGQHATSITNHTKNAAAGGRVVRHHAPKKSYDDDLLHAGDDDDDDDEEAEQSRRPFLMMNAAKAATKKDSPIVNPFVSARIRSCWRSLVPLSGCGCSRHRKRQASAGRCCRSGLLSSFQCGVLLLLVLVFVVSVAVPLLYHYAEQLAGDKTLAWRVDVYPNNQYILNTNTNQQQQQQQQVDDENDDLSTGKSCEYRRGRWHCRDCGGPETAATTASPRRSSCQTLQPRGHCKPFRRDEWDDPQHPRSVSQFDATSTSEVEFRTLSTLGRYYYHNHPQCTVDSCLDLDKCGNNTSIDDSKNSSKLPFVLTVFVNTTGPHTLVDYAASLGLVQRVHRYQDACLSITFTDTYPTVQDMLTSDHWHATKGRNNLVYDWSRFTFNHTAKRLSSDAPFSLYHIGHAAIASESLTSAIYRPGYDLALPLRRQWGRAAAPAAVDLHRPRKWLLTFRGSVKDRPQPYHQHRWLAAEYWDTSQNDVLVDVQCTRSWLLGAFPQTYKTYDHRSKTIYNDLMWNSTFGFCPGGSGVGTYRFGEVLSTGGIPVVTHDLVLPLQPEMDWTGCTVRVSEARIIDLPAMLRRMPPAEIRQRQVRCWQLLQSVLGDAPDEEQGVYRSQYRVTFAKAMEIWAARIATALEMRERLRLINNYEP